MLLSFGLLLLIGLFVSSIFKKIKLPRVIGILFSGIVLGPFVLNLIHEDILNISTDLRELALIIILIKAGLSLNLGDLNKIGRPAALMAFLPASFEILAYFIFAPLLLGISQSEALVLGAVLAAVSPAIVVPRMVHLIEEKHGTNKNIPQLILAGASCDDVFVIVLFTAFSSMAMGQSVSVYNFLSIPLSILLGLIIGGIIGFALSLFFNYELKHRRQIRHSVKVVIFLAIAFIVVAAEQAAFIPFSGLLAIISMACVYKVKTNAEIVTALSLKFSKLWIVAEIILFILIGAAVDPSYILKAGLPALLLIFIGLLIRTLGVILSLVKTNLTFKETLFCVFAYLPKATVQAAIGAIPLSMGMQSGNIILSVAVLGIIVTAPLGAMAIDYSYKKLLKNCN